MLVHGIVTPSIPKGPFAHEIFLYIFCRTFQCYFYRARACNKIRKCKLAVTSMRLLCDLSPRYRSGFEHVGNLTQLGSDFWELATNIPLESHTNRNEIATSLHFREKLHWTRARQKLHQNHMCKRALKDRWYLNLVLGE